MQKSLEEFISLRLVQQYFEEGVVYLPHLIQQGWIEKLRIGVDKNIASPSPRGRVWDKTSMAMSACLMHKPGR